MFDSSSPIDFALLHQDPTHGFQSLLDAGLDPAEEMMRKEEGDAPAEEVDRAMVFRRLLVFCHEGTLDPVVWADRAFALARVAHPGLVCRLHADVWAARCRELGELARVGVVELERRKVGAARSVWDAQGLLSGHSALEDVVPRDAPDRWSATVRAVLELLFEDGLDPERVAKRLAAFAMVFHQRLLVGASCDDVGKIFDQCRASVSWRVRQVFNVPVERSGGVAHAAFQKSAGAVARYSEVQKGNRNRRKVPEGKTRDTRRKV